MSVTILTCMLRCTKSFTLFVFIAFFLQCIFWGASHSYGALRAGNIELIVIMSLVNFAIFQLRGETLLMTLYFSLFVNNTPWQLDKSNTMASMVGNSMIITLQCCIGRDLLYHQIFTYLTASYLVFLSRDYRGFPSCFSKVSSQVVFILRQN